jgi:hypothetical protein
VRSRNPFVHRWSIIRHRNISSTLHIDLVRLLILTATKPGLVRKAELLGIEPSLRRESHQ